MLTALTIAAFVSSGAVLAASMFDQSARIARTERAIRRARKAFRHAARECEGAKVIAWF